jgi:hypothetical protein
MSRVQPHPSAPHEEGAHHPAAGQQQHIPVQSLNQTAEFFLSNYRLGKTLGIGSFGKVRGGPGSVWPSSPAVFRKLP